MQLLLTFSFYTNWKQTFDTTKRPGSGQIYCLNGMRFLSMTWIMSGHIFDWCLYFMPWIDFIDIAIKKVG